MKKMLFELLISPLSISDNYVVNSIVIALIGFLAYKIAFKIVGDIGVRGGLGSLLHWIIRLLLFVLLWGSCCIAVIATKFVISHIVFISILVVGLGLILLLSKYIYNRVICN